jgi:glycosyltransferase involved in cell wall biosynthesis
MKFNQKFKVINSSFKEKDKFPFRPKILIVADSPNWAFAQIQEEIIDALSSKYDFYWDFTYCHHFRTIDYKENFIQDFFYRLKHNFKAFIYPQNTRKCVWSKHTLTPFWEKKFVINNEVFSRRVLPPWKTYDGVLMLDYYFDRVAQLKFNSKNIAKGVFTSTFPPLGMQIDYVSQSSIPFDPIPSHEEFFKKYFTGTKAIVLGAPELAKFYGNFGVPTFFCGTITNENKKKRIKPQRELIKPIVFGWMGNPNRTEKHFWDIVYPVLSEFEQKGEIVFKTRFSGPREDLPEFIQDVDIFVSASESDVGPFMFVESALYEVPCITTRHGHAAIAIEDGINGWFIEPNIQSLRQVVQSILNDITVLEKVRKNVRQDFLKHFNFYLESSKWDSFFQFLIAKKG